MVKSKFSFFQIQGESSSGYSVELLQPTFSKTQERLNAVDMVLAPSKLIGTVVHSKALIKAYVYQSLRPRGSPYGCYMPPYYRLQCGYGTVGHDLSMDSNVSFQQAEYNRFSIGATATITSDTARTKARFINFNRTLEWRLLFTRSSDSRSKFQVGAINRAQKLPEFLLADSGITAVLIFSNHLKKLTRFNQLLTS